MGGNKYGDLVFEPCTFHNPDLRTAYRVNHKDRTYFIHKHWHGGLSVANERGHYFQTSIDGEPSNIVGFTLADAARFIQWEATIQSLLGKDEVL